MRKIAIILFVVLILGPLGWGNAHASLLQDLGDELDRVNNNNPPYPFVLSQPLDVLPQGFITIVAGDETYYYQNGYFYQMIMRIQKYLLVPPPIGAVVYSIPQGYELMLIDGKSFYEAKGVYYKRDLDGFRVIYPPQ